MCKSWMLNFFDHQHKGLTYSKRCDLYRDKPTFLKNCDYDLEALLVNGSSPHLRIY